MVAFESETEWSQAGEGLLSCSWDEELGTLQAQFSAEEGKWRLNPGSTHRSTRHNMERIEDPVLLAEGDLLKAANTWLQVSVIG